MADTDAPDFSVRMLGEEALGCSEGIVVNHIAAAVNIYGDDFSIVGRFHLAADGSLV